MDTDGPLYQHYAVGDVKHFAAFARICPVFVCPRAFIINAPQALVSTVQKTSSRRRSACPCTCLEGCPWPKSGSFLTRHGAERPADSRPPHKISKLKAGKADASSMSCLQTTHHFSPCSWLAPSRTLPWRLACRELRAAGHHSLP